jgi:hypothetical protein
VRADYPTDQEKYMLHVMRERSQTMDKSFLDAVTKTLNDFALTKFTAQVLELKGPIQEGSSYRWRLMSNRYKEVTVLLVTKKLFLGKTVPVSFEIYGLQERQKLGPTLQELQSYLATAELEALR